AREAVRRAPHWPGGYTALAQVLAARGCRADALSAYDRALELAPADPEARDGRASPLGAPSALCPQSPGRVPCTLARWNPGAVRAPCPARCPTAACAGAP